MAIALPPVALAYTHIPLSSQPQTAAPTTPVAVLGSECLRYAFRQGDSLVYEFQSRDTITIGDRPTIYRTRTEVVSLVCDFVDPQGRMYLRQTLERYKGSEHTLKEQGDTRTSSPWIGRSAYIIIDSGGKRSISRQADTIHAALTPGGAFQPFLLIPFGDSLCRSKQNNHAWLHPRQIDTLAENGYPYPLVGHVFSYVIRDVKDTLGKKAYGISYAQTGQASVRVVSGDAAVYMRSVINAGGDIVHSIDGIPLCGSMGIHNKLTILMEKKPETNGTSTSYTDYHLIYPPPPPVQENVKKKSKVRKSKKTP